MEEETSQEKTQEPSEHRLEEARKRGEFPISRDFIHWCVLGMGAVFILFFISHVFFVLDLLPFLGRIHDLVPDYTPPLLSRMFWGVFSLFCFSAVSILSTMTQTQGGVTWTHLQPKWERISPQSGLKKVFSKKALVEFFKNMLKAVILLFFLWCFVLRPLIIDSYQYLGFSLKDLVFFARSVTGKVFIVTLCVFFFVAILDIFLQRYTFFEKLKMSTQELKDEHKETQGNPGSKARIRQIRQSKAQRYMMKEIPKATVVITNPTHYAIALFWNENTPGAPKVVAKGLDYLALKIKEIAQEHKVPVIENKALARSLYEGVGLNQSISPHHYRAVAEIIRLVLSMKKANRPLMYS